MRSRMTRLAQKCGLAALLTLTTLGTLEGAAQAQLCIQQADGIPGGYDEAPRWWPTPAPAPVGSSTDRWIDDPRWRGATAVGGLNDNYRFRGVIEKVGSVRHLVLMWVVNAPPEAVGAVRMDRLIFGFLDDASSDGLVFRIDPSPLDPTPDPAGLDGNAGGFSGKFYFRSAATAGNWQFQNGDPDGSGGAGPSLVPPLPSWLKDDGRVDLFAGEDEWTVRVRLPIDPAADVSLINPAGIKLTTGGNYKFFYQIQDITPGDFQANYSHPAGLPVVQTDVSGTCATGICLPADAAWGAFQDTANCQGDIAIRKSDIYVGSAGNTQISLTAVNDIQAHPLNNTAGDIAFDAVKGTFRIANWGSTIGVSPTWETACADVAGTDNPGGDGQIDSMTQFNLACPFSVLEADRCKYVTAAMAATAPFNGWGCSGVPTRSLDQCVLVDLATNGAHGPYVFAPQSEYKNLMFSGASVFTKEATLDIKGIALLAPPKPKRDLFVYIKTSNMPTRIDANTPPPRALQSKSFQATLRKLEIQLPTQGAFGKEAGSRLMRAMDQGLLSYEDIKAILPTYEAFVWHETGEEVAGKKLIEAQPSFTYVMWHEGDVKGWRHQFEGSDITEISPNFYKVAVPDGGTATVKTTIEAVEKLCDNGQMPPCSDTGPVVKPCPDPSNPACPKPFNWWWLVLLVILALGLLVYLGFINRKK